MLKELGEGGYAFVYLVTEVSNASNFGMNVSEMNALDNAQHATKSGKSSSAHFALKRVLIQNKEQLREVRREIDIHSKLCHHPHIITLMDSELTTSLASPQAPSSSDSFHARQALLLFPVYSRGTLLEYTLALAHGDVHHMTTTQIINIFMGICSALHMMHHTYHLAHRDIKPGNILLGGQFTPGIDSEDNTIKNNNGNQLSDNKNDGDGDDDDDDERIEEEKDEGEEEQLLETIAITENDETTSQIQGNGHMKSPLHGVLIDFGSCNDARTMITSRQDALAMQEDAARCCTAPYRAPELWDVASECVIDEKVDIWSLGCTLYACIFGKSPFESAIDESGGSLMLAVLSGKMKWWEDYSNKSGSTNSNGMPFPEYVYLKAVVQKMVQVESSARPSAEQVIMMLQRIQDHCNQQQKTG